jgi:hypothetical protein
MVRNNKVVPIFPYDSCRKTNNIYNLQIRTNRKIKWSPERHGQSIPCRSLSIQEYILRIFLEIARILCNLQAQQNYQILFNANYFQIHNIFEYTIFKGGIKIFQS